ncbi:MAG: hypothetical protein ACRCZ2_07235 [Fusobacteriaceae bacterium]
MAVVIYNLDKVERAVYKVKIEGVEYEIKEPSVSDFSLIQQIDFESQDSHIELFKIMIPLLDFSSLTKQQFGLLIEICFKVIKGDGAKKKPTVEDLME